MVSHGVLNSDITDWPTWKRIGVGWGVGFVLTFASLGLCRATWTRGEWFVLDRWTIIMAVCGPSSCLLIGGGLQAIERCFRNSTKSRALSHGLWDQELDS